MRASWWHPVERFQQNRKAKSYNMYRGHSKQAMISGLAEMRSARAYEYPTPRGSGIKRIFPPDTMTHPVRAGYSPHELFPELREGSQ